MRYSDVYFVEAVYKRDHAVERALYDYCKHYFDNHYKAVFFKGDKDKPEIFQEAFITLWEKIEKRKIYVEEGVLKGKGGMPLSGKLTTYLMGIAWRKNLEFARENRHTRSIEELLRDEKIVEMKNASQYDSCDEDMLEVIADCISHMPERCNQILTMFYYEENTLDDILIKLPTFESKNALKTAKYKCMENLRKSAKEIYRKNLNI